MEEVGQALMWRAVEAAPGIPRLGKRKWPGRAAQDAYEDHMVLPDDRVALLTNQRVMLLNAPGFARLDDAARDGLAPGREDDVPVGEIRWSVEWQVRYIHVTVGRCAVKSPLKPHACRVGGLGIYSLLA